MGCLHYVYETRHGHIQSFGLIRMLSTSAPSEMPAQTRTMKVNAMLPDTVSGMPGLQAPV